MGAFIPNSGSNKIPKNAAFTGGTRGIAETGFLVLLRRNESFDSV